MKLKNRLGEELVEFFIYTKHSLDSGSRPLEADSSGMTGNVAGIQERRELVVERPLKWGFLLFFHVTSR